MNSQPSNVVPFPRNIAMIESAIDTAIQMADEIIALTAEENRRLEEMKLPQLEDLLPRKQQLISDFTAFFKVFLKERESFFHASNDKCNALQERVQSLAHIIFANEANLDRAIKTNQKRIDTIMRAIRESQKEVALSSYGANGYQTTGTMPNISIKRSMKV